MRIDLNRNPGTDEGKGIASDAPATAGWRRRGMLAALALGGGGLAVAWAVRRSSSHGLAGGPAREVPAGAFAPSALLRVAADGRVTIVCRRAELGQGVSTALPMLVAEELGANWSLVSVELGGLDTAADNQPEDTYTADSRSIASDHESLRRLGAAARTLLVAAAAQRLGVPPGECEAHSGRVWHTASGRSLPFGELAGDAARMPLPRAADMRLKDSLAFRLIGQRIGQVDAARIAAGAPLYGSDVRLPGMRYAVYAKAPVFGAAVQRVDLDALKAMPGVRDAFVLAGGGNLRGLNPGVAVVADSTWAALQARQQIDVLAGLDGQSADAPAGSAALLDSDELLRRAEQVAGGEGDTVLRDDGDAPAALTRAAKRLEAAYVHPFLAHAAMEPLSCTAHWHDGQLDLWAASQNPWGARELVSQTLELAPEKITLHPLRAGGSFGRRLGSDFIVEAAAIAMRTSTPVQLVWRREDDLRHDHYRPGGVHRLQAGLDASGAVVAWSLHQVSFGADGKAGGGAAVAPNEFPARWVLDCRMSLSVLDVPIPLGLWRAPGSHATAWAVQSFLDELAHAAGRDPLAFRLALLGSQAQVRGGGLLSRAPPYRVDRMRAVLQAAAQAAQWGRSLPRGQGQGIAFHHCHGGYVAQVVDVAVSPQGAVAIERVVCVCDVGSPIVNRLGAEAQVQGAIVDGLSAALGQEVVIRGGRVQPGNFDHYPLLRMAQAPRRIDIQFIESASPPTGLGEPALPPVAPALCNAIFRATGHRIRRLPVSRNDLAWPHA
jgi:isoquinoline 1-oxidoreductase subunit beta